jgi:hypothetical protein
MTPPWAEPRDDDTELARMTDDAEPHRGEPLGELAISVQTTADGARVLHFDVHEAPAVIGLADTLVNELLHRPGQIARIEHGVLSIGHDWAAPAVSYRLGETRGRYVVARRLPEVAA